MPSCHLILTYESVAEADLSRTLHPSLGWTEPAYQHKRQRGEADKERVSLLGHDGRREHHLRLLDGGVDLGGEGPWGQPGRLVPAAAQAAAVQVAPVGARVGGAGRSPVHPSRRIRRRQQTARCESFGLLQFP